ncbi:uncharacterized protein LOC142985353 isoform X2 [Anticarsia gemmatalis]|uniref:uncharacterized protein LOC142985353 isoform X2 n=1 Tax=Anticarsia gemmatalis TaxID=129554 RepID=UPI003F759F2C
MSRYNEDWERRKSYLIRSLFQDIPYRILSPVIEETTQSSNLQPRTSTPSSDFSKSATIPEEISSSGTATSLGQTTRPQYRQLTPSVSETSELNRPYSPLPPLIIEREPNKHDEPAEYYKTLLIKIRKIYAKMFIENRTLSDDFVSDHEFQHGVEFPPICDSYSDVGRSSSVYSNGYTADLESSGESILEPDSLDSIVIEELMKSTKEDTNVNLNRRNSNEIGDLAVEEVPEQSSISNGDSDYRQITTAADVHIDGTPHSEVTPSPVYEELLHIEHTEQLTNTAQSTHQYKNKLQNLERIDTEMTPIDHICTTERPFQGPQISSIDIPNTLPSVPLTKSPIFTRNSKAIYSVPSRQYDMDTVGHIASIPTVAEATITQSGDENTMESISRGTLLELPNQELVNKAESLRKDQFGTIQNSELTLKPVLTTESITELPTIRVQSLQISQEKEQPSESVLTPERRMQLLFASIQSPSAVDEAVTTSETPRSVSNQERLMSLPLTSDLSPSAIQANTISETPRSVSNQERLMSLPFTSNQSPSGLHQDSPTFSISSRPILTPITAMETLLTNISSIQMSPETTETIPRLVLSQEAQKKGNKLVPISSELQIPFESHHIRYLSPVPECSESQFGSRSDVSGRECTPGEDRSPILKSGQFRRVENDGSLMGEDVGDKEATPQRTTDSTTNTKDPSCESREADTQSPAFVLRFSRTCDQSRGAGNLTMDTNLDPDTSPSTEDTHTSNIEAMRTPQRSSRHSLQIDSTRLTSDMELTCEHNTIPRDISTETSVSQYGADVNTAIHHMLQKVVDTRASLDIASGERLHFIRRLTMYTYKLLYLIILLFVNHCNREFGRIL